MFKAMNLTLTVVAVTIGLHASGVPAAAQTPNVVIQWNEIAQTLFGGTGPGVHLRAVAMMHIAMFDAINSIEGVYTPYLTEVRGSYGASPDAAAAAAARDVLTALYPTQQATFDRALAGQLAGIAGGAVQQGVVIGQTVARAVLQWRHNDGWPATIVPDPTYVLPTFPGVWQPTPPANGFATFTFFPKVKPFAMLTSTQFLPPPPPPLTGARYAADLNETKSLGSATSAARTPDETLMAQVHAGINVGIGFFHVWHRVGRSVAEGQGLSLVDTARMFVLLAVGLHDGLQTSFTGKVTYALWRPVTAIRRADEDQNPATDADPTWTPLLPTPTYSSYPGNVACLSAASARALQLAVGRDDIPFSVTYPRTMGLPTETRSYTGVWDLAQQEARSRVLGGIHFQFDSDASQAACVKIPEFAAAHFMLPLTTPPAPAACTTPAPAAGWVCVNGGWVPPGHPLAGPAPIPPPTTPPVPAACTTAAPAAGWVCVNGGWVPPGHPLAGPSTIPPPITAPGCPGPDPFAGIPGLVGVCINGGWVPRASGGTD